MKKMVAFLIVFFIGSIGMMGCGGGGGDGDGGNTTPVTTVLEGTWIYSSDDHPTGGACGLDIHGHPGHRVTFVFNYNQFTAEEEGCVILSGNTGAYFELDYDSGTFIIGNIYVRDPGSPYEMTAIDFKSETTIYSSLNLTGNELHIATITEEYDGTTPEKRAFMNDYLNPAFIKQ